MNPPLVEFADAVLLKAAATTANNHEVRSFFQSAKKGNTIVSTKRTASTWMSPVTFSLTVDQRSIGAGALHECSRAPIVPEEGHGNYKFVRGHKWRAAA